MVKKRDEIPEALTWDLTSIFETDADFEDQLEAVAGQIEESGTLTGRLSQSADDLLEVTNRLLNLGQAVERLYVYASMKNDQDTQVATYQAMQSHAQRLYTQYQTAFAFYEPELLSLPSDQLASFIASSSELQNYQHFFDRLVSKKAHTLSFSEERLLSQASELLGAPSEIFEILDNADIQLPKVTDENGQTIQLSHGNFGVFLRSKDRKVRQSAYQALYDYYKAYQNTYAKTLEANVKAHNFEAGIRHYESARSRAMSDNHIPEVVYDVLVERVHEHLPLLHRYMQLRQKFLGLSDYAMYDIHVSLADQAYPISYDKAKQETRQVLSVLGKDYLEVVDQAFEARWIDVEENQGKRSGAYSGGSYDTNPFILLNWQDDIDSFYTLVHEMGHSVHSAFSRKHQPYVYGDYSIFLAEIASTTNENILTEHLLDELKDDLPLKLAVLSNYLDGFRGTVFRQTQFAEFEHQIHQAQQAGQALTGQYLNQLYAELNETYYGLSKEDNPEIAYEWARIPHFYYNYYVYQYATGFAAASYLANKIVSGSDEDRAAYLTYLKAGNSDYPLNVIKKAGVDMTDSTYLNSAFKTFEARLDEFEALIQQLQDQEV